MCKLLTIEECANRKEEERVGRRGEVKQSKDWKQKRAGRERRRLQKKKKEDIAKQNNVGTLKAVLVALQRERNEETRKAKRKKK